MPLGMTNLLSKYMICEMLRDQEVYKLNIYDIDRVSAWLGCDFRRY